MSIYKSNVEFSTPAIDLSNQITAQSQLSGSPNQGKYEKCKNFSANILYSVSKIGFGSL